MLWDAIGALVPGGTMNTFGHMCDQVTFRPHVTIKGFLKKLYGFASDYPGIRHGSRAKGALRAIDMPDMVGMSILIAEFTPNLERRLSAEAIYAARTHASPAAQPVPVPANGAVDVDQQARGFIGRLFDRMLRGSA